MTAIEKIKSQQKNMKLSDKAQAVSDSVIKALTLFCEQNTEFAQAIEQSDKTLADCINHTVAECGGSISDLEVYKRAVSFYFHGADVRFNMIIDVGDGGFSNAPQAQIESPAATGISMSLDSLLDF